MTDIGEKEHLLTYRKLFQQSVFDLGTYMSGSRKGIWLTRRTTYMNEWCGAYGVRHSTPQPSPTQWRGLFLRLFLSLPSDTVSQNCAVYSTVSHSTVYG